MGIDKSRPSHEKGKFGHGKGKKGFGKKGKTKVYYIYDTNYLEEVDSGAGDLHYVEQANGEVYDQCEDEEVNSPDYGISDIMVMTVLNEDDKEPECVMSGGRAGSVSGLPPGHVIVDTGATESADLEMDRF